MKVSVNYSAQLSAAAGTPRECIELDRPHSVRDFARRLAERHGDPLKGSILDEHGLLRRNVFVCVNDEQADAEGGAMLNDGDTLLFMLPISGG